jgi:hypothetical protein
MGTKGWTALLLGWLMVACCSCERNNETPNAMDQSSPPVLASKSRGGVYSRYNVHYYTRKDLNIASYANYTDCPGHAFLPYNTEFKVGSYGKGFKLTAVDTGLVILFEYRSANMGGMSVKDYIDTIMSPTPVSYEGLSAVDQEGIKAGRAMVGMTKQGVMIALGYPAKHETPSTDLNAWTYWKGRYNRLVVNFGEDGRVESTR